MNTKAVSSVIDPDMIVNECMYCGGGFFCFVWVCFPLCMKVDVPRVEGKLLKRKRLMVLECMVLRARGKRTP